MSFYSDNIVLELENMLELDDMLEPDDILESNILESDNILESNYVLEPNYINLDRSESKNIDSNEENKNSFQFFTANY
ncbi:2421_t:CDS:2 [Scutellospora calospora]|uniref:2421_t:CDS:1 n=1 Tax=Scutellospora calospora TaxID=85575 RepID=A0ACA9K5M4_9GLOM|nr:2421_t:CDS:2 [Scutellospora calospora]